MNSSVHNEVLAEVRRDIAAMESRLTELRAVEKYHASHVDSAGSPVPKKLRGMKQFDAAAVVLKNAGTPLKTAAIVEQMAAAGFPFKDIQLAKTSLFSTLSRKSDMFEKAGKGMWQLISTNGDGH